MTPYVGCDHARELLEPFLDGEISIDDQVAIEAHLRWCQTCAARIDDLRVIGASVRGAPVAAGTCEDEEALAAIQSGVLARVRAERDEAFLSRIRVSCSDTRLLFPALGATMALMLCFGLTVTVQATTSRQLTEMLIARTPPRVIDEGQAPYAVRMLEQSADPGSDQNPMRLDDAFASPQLVNALSLIEGIKDEEAVFNLATVVSRKGRIENYELLRSSDGRRAMIASDSVLNAVRQSRFSPAQDHGGDPIATIMVWRIEKTSVAARFIDKPAVPVARRRPAPVLVPPPPQDDLVPAIPGRSGSILGSTTA
jgi:anti-sigma factor RsiW